MNTIAQNQKAKYESEAKAIVDPSLEVLDPNPDIYDLFRKFDDLFFWGKLKCVEVGWSKRMTSCAGICYFSPREFHCRINLSAPLLSLRPRTDYVNTLLHEMIHAFLFITFNNRDRDGHGPEFHNHMARINGRAGTNITVYHTFHDEVRFFKSHVWRCNGVCRSQAPFFGIVRRASNRAPSKQDRWWGAHQAKCQGTFEKIEEPEGFKSKKKKVEGAKEISKPKSKTPVPLSDIRNFFTPNGDSKKKEAEFKGPLGTLGNFAKTGKITTINDLKSPGGNNPRTDNPNFKKTPKLGTSNIHGFGNSKFAGKGGQNMLKNKGSATFVVTGKPTNTESVAKGNSTTTKPPTATVSKPPTDIRNHVRNVWANKYPDVQKVPEKVTENGRASNVTNKYPDMKKAHETDPRNDLPKKLPEPWPSTSSQPGTSQVKRKLEDEATVCDDCDEIVFQNSGHDCKKKESFPCPVCEKAVARGKLEAHLSSCLGETIDDSVVFCDDDEDEWKMDFVPDKDEKEESFPCPVCAKKILSSQMNSHIDECLNLAFIGETYESL